MASAASIPYVSVDTYLHSFDFEPDMDYVDGVLEERNLGEIEHSDLQGALYAFFLLHRAAWNIRVNVEARVQVSATRYRIPDVCILRADWKKTSIVREAPLLCLEVKSPSFTLARERKRAEDYLRMGVPEVWVFDPEKRSAYVMRGDTMTEQREGVLKLAGTAIEVDLVGLFAVLDE